MAEKSAVRMRKIVEEVTREINGEVVGTSKEYEYPADLDSALAMLGESEAYENILANMRGKNKTDLARLLKLAATGQEDKKSKVRQIKVA